MATWYQRRRKPTQHAALPSAWAFNAPTSDQTSGSTSVVAAASRVTEEKVKRERTTGPGDNWQEEAWFMYDQVGELRYVSNAIAGRMGQAELYVTKDGVRQEDDPILSLITPQMVESAGLNLFIAGGCYLAGLPANPEDIDAADGTSIQPEGAPKTAWVILSALEVKRDRNGSKVDIRGETYDLDKIYLERIWDPHPARWEMSDSPVRSALPVLRELVGLTQHVSAQIDSRLAGAGVYWLPNSILNASKTPTTDDQGDATTFHENPVLNAIMNAMLTPMEDRSNAAAVVPLLMGAPDDAIDKIRYDSFATAFDENTKELREEAIRRLGLALDSPPELLSGMGDANHWGMWLVRDEVIQAHVKPRLDLLCDALTTGFYRPILKQTNPDEDPSLYVVHADVSQLVQRPNRLADASQLHAVGALSDRTLRQAGGFEETDAPTSNERAIAIAIQTAQANPQLIDNMPEIVAAVTALLDGTPATGVDKISSQRVPGTLKPLVPNTSPVVGVEAAPNGTNVKNQPKPLQETDARPGSRPV